MLLPEVYEDSRLELEAEELLVVEDAALTEDVEADETAGAVLVDPDDEAVATLVGEELPEVRDEDATADLVDAEAALEALVAVTDALALLEAVAARVDAELAMLAEREDEEGLPLVERVVVLVAVLVPDVEVPYEAPDERRRLLVVPPV